MHKHCYYFFEIKLVWSSLVVMNLENLNRDEEDFEEKDDVKVLVKLLFHKMGNGARGGGRGGLMWLVIKKCEVLLSTKTQLEKNRNRIESVDKVYFSSVYKYQAVILHTARLQSDCYL